MKYLEVTQHVKKFDYKSGDQTPFTESNINEDTIFLENGIPIGFYLSKMPEKACKIADICDSEFKSNRVPKAEMVRSDVMQKSLQLGLVGKVPITIAMRKALGTTQFSTSLGSIPPKPHMRRYLPKVSAVHSVKTAETFLKAMWRLALESEKIIKEVAPNIWEQQNKIMSNVIPEWKFGKLFTSSISNFNISAPYHRDIGNIKGCVNVIITKRRNSKGGCLNVPEYGITIEQADNSILVYPAWKNMHGVTPIIPTHEEGYRNSLIFYSLSGFFNEDLDKNLIEGNED
jgi:hypothetical protein